MTVPKDKNYRLCFQGKLREPPKYIRRILAVGISYNKKPKEYCCKVEVFEKGKSVLWSLVEWRYGSKIKKAVGK